MLRSHFWHASFIALCLQVGMPAAAEEKFEYLPELETVTLKPTMRPEPYSATLYRLNLDKITKQVDNVLLFDSIDQFQALPHIVSFEEKRKLAHEGQIAFTKGLKMRDDYTEYSLLKPGRELKHPTTGEVIGVQGFVNGSAVVEEFGEPQTVRIKHCMSAVELNSRLVPLVGLDLPAFFDVKYPPKAMSGYILAFEQDIFGGGEYTPVVVSLGESDGLKQGHVLDILEKQIEITDPNTRQKVALPIEKIGEVLIYKVGKKISLGIITYSDRAVIVNDPVSAGEPGL